MRAAELPGDAPQKFSAATTLTTWLPVEPASPGAPAVLQDAHASTAAVIATTAPARLRTSSSGSSVGESKMKSDFITEVNAVGPSRCDRLGPDRS